jgi:hypothetical protein
VLKSFQGKIKIVLIGVAKRIKERGKKKNVNIILIFFTFLLRPLIISGR